MTFGKNYFCEVVRMKPKRELEVRKEHSSFAMKMNMNLLEARGRYGTLRAFIRHITSANCILFLTFEEWIPRFTLI